MRTLIDTNILTRLAPSQDALHTSAVGSFAALRAQGDDLVIVPQNVYEFWVVATRSQSQNGLGLSVTEADTELARLRSLCLLLDDTPAVLVQWHQLVKTHQVVGKNAHDAHLVAAMLVHGIDKLLTSNPADFQRFPGIAVLTPALVLGATP